MTKNKEKLVKDTESSSEVLVKEVRTLCIIKGDKTIDTHLVYNPESFRYDCNKNLNGRILKHLISEDKKGFIINFGVVKGDFDCSNLGLESLKGAPIEVGGSFYCFNNHLTSLEGAPQKVGGNFDCFKNQISSLEGAPKEVGGDFYYSRNNLTSLKGAPTEVKGSFHF